MLAPRVQAGTKVKSEKWKIKVKVKVKVKLKVKVKSEDGHMLTPRVQAGTKVSPDISVKAASPAEGSTNSSPFKENTEN